MFEEVVKNKPQRVILLISLGLILYFGLIILLILVERENFQWLPVTTAGRAIAAVFLLYSIVIFGFLIAYFTTLMATNKEKRKFGYTGTDFEGHAVIIGWNDFGKLVLEQLIGVGKKVAIVTSNREDIDLIQEQYNQNQIFTLYADLTNYELLRKANIEQCSIVFINLNDDTEKLVYILNMKKLYPNLEYVVTLEKGDLKNTFMSAGVTNTISKHEIASKLLASYMFEPDVAAFSETILTFAEGDGDYDLKQLIVTRTNPYAGRTYQETFFDLKKKYNTLLIGITKRDKFGKKRLLKNPLGELKISPGDYLILMLNGKAYNLLRKIFSVNEGYIRERKKTD